MKQLLRALCASVLASSLIVPAAFGQHAGKGSSKNQNGNDEDLAVSASGQQVAIDPATGKIRQPTNEEIKQSTDALKLNDSVEGLVPVVTDSGALMVDLQDRMQNVAVAKINPDGTISQACVTNSKQTSEFLKKKTGKGEKPKAAPSKTTSTDPSTWEVK